MAADAAIPVTEQPYTWLRCICGNGLWKQFADHFEMTISPRGGQKRLISVPAGVLLGLTVKCEKCGRDNVTP